MCAENVLNGTEGTYRNYLFRENVLGGTESWFLTMTWVYPLTPNQQQACHGISIRQSLGDKGFPTPDPNFGKTVLKVNIPLRESRKRLPLVRKKGSGERLEHVRAGQKQEKHLGNSEVLFLEWEQRESNPRPSACKADALNQLSYAPKHIFIPT